MKKGLLFMGTVLVLTPTLLTRSGVEFNDFVQGIVFGIGFACCVVGLMKARLAGRRA
ncbi:hypothetical protein DFQ01_12582 [Paenibacillus cellulosilyticus]|uniref:Uncharacterized protein n=1 Tax=Paenibacillus cellulosilyticus TaxID=375489 RepID=A0A2V2YMN1_9BACL|nr:hypothetical protein [Paenibacillus cellulosilyticus]PWV95736.1 hypothetical protein DFQ01_12582 [Paenibacillus cellulosilyticus]QKS47632.1 hypothetical protein HUB94_25040 [Paenibacillus cellulosilyticus]